MDQMEKPWLAHYDEIVPSTVDYIEAPLFQFLDKAAETNPNERAVIFQNTSIRYKKLKELSETVAANLRDQGIQPGDRVAVMLPNLPQTIIAFWGILKAGAVVVMVNPLYMEKELVHQIRDSQARMLVTLDLLWSKLAPLKESLGIEKYFVTRISEALSFPLNILYDFNNKRNGKFCPIPFDDQTVFPWKKLLQGKKRFCAVIENPKETLAMLQYTGGTTGVSKGVLLTHCNLHMNIQQTLPTLRYASGGKNTFLALLPYFHVYGLSTCLCLPTAVAATIVPYPRFVPHDVLVGVQKYKATILPGAPSIYIALLQQKDLSKFDLTSIRMCISGSAPMPVEYLKKFTEVTGACMIEGYGLSEASPITHLNPIRKANKSGSIGVPLPDTEARIVDMEVGILPVPTGCPGELIIRGPQVASGYWNRPDETANTFRNGWLYTGDIAIMDEEGYFTIVDRKKDMIVVGGYNVYPREIDEVLHEHPLVKEAVSVGISHPTRGETIKAYIVPVEGATLTKEDIISHCRKRLANYKMPRQVEFREELPKTLVGKILRRALIAEEQQKFSSGPETESIKSEREKAD